MSPQQQALSKGEFQKALKIGREILLKNGNDSQALLLTGISCIELARSLTQESAIIGAHREALRCFNRFVVLNPKHGESRVHQSLSRCHQVLKNKSESIRHGKLAVELEPSSAMAHRVLGEAYQLAGRPTEALAEIKAAHLLDPGNAEYLEAVQVQLHAMRRFGETIQYLEEHQSKVLPDKENQYLLHWVFHVSWLALNNVDQSHKAILKARQYGPNKSRLLSPLAESHYRKGDLEGAELWATKTLRHPKSSNTSHAVAQRTLGLIEMHRGNYAEAKTLLESALQVLKRDGSATLALISTLRRLGETEKAMELAEEYRKNLEDQP